VQGLEFNTQYHKKDLKKKLSNSNTIFNPFIYGKRKLVTAISSESTLEGACFPLPFLVISSMPFMAVLRK
jgi:hypothetical protein